MSQPLLATALAALEDLRNHLHHDSNRAFFAERFVCAADFRAQEQTVRCAMQLLDTMVRTPAPPRSVQEKSVA